MNWGWRYPDSLQNKRGGRFRPIFALDLQAQGVGGRLGGGGERGLDRVGQIFGRELFARDGRGANP